MRNPSPFQTLPSTSLIMWLLQERVGPLPQGTAYKIMHLHERAWEDQPVRESAKRRLCTEVAHHAGTDTPDAVTVEHFTPKALTDAWREHTPMDSHPIHVHTLVGYMEPL